MKIGKQLKSFRKDTGLSVREVASIIKMEFSTLSRIESGFIKDPKFCDVIKLCEFYKTDVRILK